MSRQVGRSDDVIEHGLAGVLPYAAIGAGPPLALLAGLSPFTGAGSDLMVRSMLAPVWALRDRRRLVLLNRRTSLEAGMAMADFAAEVASGLRATFSSQVDVIGVSTGGSIAQQLAADHPDTVKRLILLSAACRLGPNGKLLQRRVAARIRAGSSRQALALLARGLVPTPLQVPAGVAVWVLASRLTPGTDGLTDMATTIEAEDDFDLAHCSSQIQAPTLILAGSNDRIYSPDLFAETGRLIPEATVRVFDGRGHITVINDDGCRQAIGSFVGCSS